ncbi:MmgE/PrpD family protein [Plastorhodobacter daqingensis]|uniref:MmgE/PrpD family protein n=1 Tax=Plastorhodobacter daqingensis TaxID=1387281 RepID=A0ABW2ULK6_9RHOB
MSLSHELAAAYAAATVPQPARDAALVALGDAVAVMIAATGLEPAAGAFARHARAMGGGGSCTIIGGGRAPPPLAALANGALAHAIDYEDTFEAGMIHPNAVLVPTVLALAESEGAGGVAEALALGCDFACRLSLALAADPAARGWYHPPVLSGLGAVMGAVRLLGLAPATTVNALGLFATQFLLSDALKHSPASHLRAVRDGLAAQAAVQSVLLAREGVVAVPAPLEGQGGVFAVLTGAPPREAPLLEGLGRRFFGPEVGLKRWPSCRGTHPAILVARALRGQIAPADIASVEVTVRPPADMLFVPRAQRCAPRSAIDAKFSVPFVFASSLLHGDPGLGSFAPARLNDPGVLQLAPKVMLGGIAPDGHEAVFKIITHSGEVLHEEVPEVPLWRSGDLTPDDLQPKIAECLVHASFPVAVSDLLAAIRTVPRQGIGALMAHLGGKAVAGGD